MSVSMTVQNKNDLKACSNHKTNATSSSFTIGFPNPVECKAWHYFTSLIFLKDGAAMSFSLWSFFSFKCSSSFILFLFQWTTINGSKLTNVEMFAALFVTYWRILVSNVFPKQGCWHARIANRIGLFQLKI